MKMGVTGPHLHLQLKLKILKMSSVWQMLGRVQEAGTGREGVG